LQRSFLHRAIYDARLIQTPPVYGVQKGALSVSTAPFNALAASNSQHTYQILVPSLNVFVDRKIVWESGVFLQSLVFPTLPCDPKDGAYSPALPLTPSSASYSAPPCFGGSASIDVLLQANPETEMYRRTLPANSFPSSGAQPAFPRTEGDYYEIAQPGTNFNLCPFPLQSLCNSMTCSINDCSVTTNGDTLQEQILLTNTRDTQRIRTTPSKFDQYAWTLDDYQSQNGNMSTFNFQRPAVGETPTGAWPITFYNPNDGTRLIDDVNNVGAYLDPNSRCPVYFMNGRPIVIPGGILAGIFIQGTPSSFSAGTPDSLGTGTATITIALNEQQQACLVPGSHFTITTLTGSYAAWNGYYTIENVNHMATTSAISFKYGRVAFAYNNSVQFVSRATVSASLPASVVITSDRLPSNDSALSFQPVTCISKLLGQILPNGIQIMPTPMNVPMTLSFLYNVAEPMVMSPFIYQDALEFSNVGLYGCTNIQFTMNIQAPSPNCQAIQQGSWPTQIAPFSVVRTNCDYPSGGNVLRTTGCVGAFTAVSLTPPAGIVSTTGAFQNPRMVVQFLTPGPDVSLPLISNVPYMEFPRYTNTYLVADPRAASLNIQSQTITLSSIPDFIMVYVKSRTRCQLQNETYVPVQRVAVTFDNFSNLCSNMTQYELYTCSVAAGLDMDYQTWRGYANASGLRLTNGSVNAAVSGAASGRSLRGDGFQTVIASFSSGSVSVSLASGAYTYVFTGVQYNNPYANAPAAGTTIFLNGFGGSLSSLNGTQIVSSTGAGTITFSCTTPPVAIVGGAITGTATGTSPAPVTGTISLPATLAYGTSWSGGTISVLTSVSPGFQGNVCPVSSGSYNLGGSKVPYELSSGTSNLWPATTGLYNVAGQNKLVPRSTTQLTGGPLMLRMGQDVSLSPGLAPGTLGNFSIQLNLTLDNSQHFFDAYSSYQLTIIAVNSGYFETVRGQSAVRKTILNMADVESASVATGVTTSQLRRLVGGARGLTLSAMGPYMGSRTTSSDSNKRPRQYTGGSGL